MSGLRLKSIYIFWALTIFLMIFVNDPFIKNSVPNRECVF